METNKVLVTCEMFTQKMNEALHHNPENEGMSFPHNANGLVLFAPMLSDSGRMALQKAIFDEVSKHYIIART